MRLQHLIFAAVLVCGFTLPAQAANCRAGVAAQAGAKTGYERDRKAAQAWEQRESRISRELQQCLGSISTSIVIPTFPDLSGILNEIKNKICKAARDKIQGYIPRQIDPWGDLPPILGKPTDTPLVTLPPVIDKTPRSIGVNIGKRVTETVLPETPKTPASPAAPIHSVSDSSSNDYLFTR
ncbi:hypothetical protein ACP179_01650 (plasmid) [Xenorhabdus stockiae]|uniref:hypothetical protein n=1 Tax=Xenorhabdus stockiae TaxID=351614 RepID=UPI003CF81B10